MSATAHLASPLLARQRELGYHLCASAHINPRILDVSPFGAPYCVDARQVPLMVRRRFTDKSGVEWEVTAAATVSGFRPLEPPRTVPFRPPTTYLLFESETEKRRLAPAPPNWQDASLDDLQRWLAEATLITLRPPKA